MSVIMLPGTGQIETVKLDQLFTLQDAGFEEWEYGMRERDEEHVSHLEASDPQDWPPLETVKVQLNGQIINAVIDGYHRWNAAENLELPSIRVVARTYTSEEQVIETAMVANLKHGKAASTQNRSQYAVWLYLQVLKKDPKSTPNISAIARKAGLVYSATHTAIKKALAEQENSEREGGNTAETDNAAKLLSALHRFYESEHTLLSNGTGSRDVQARAKALFRSIQRLTKDKQGQAAKELLSLRDTLNVFEEKHISKQTAKK